MKNAKRLFVVSLAACLALSATPVLAETTNSTDAADTAIVELQKQEKKQKKEQKQSKKGKQEETENTQSDKKHGKGRREKADDRTEQAPPELPDGQQPGGGETPPEKPDGAGQGMPGGGQDAPSEYAAANTVTEDSEDETYSSEADDENAVLVSGSEVTIANAVVDKTGSSDGESADFYGINAAILATDGATLTLAGGEITTDGMHANGVFSYGSGTTVNVSDVTIVTSGNNSGGLMTTGGAVMNAVNVTASTAGNSSAAIRSDRGGGTVNVSGGTFMTSGVGSPAIYSTADITVANADLRADNSEAVVIEGGNSVTLTDVDITGNDAQLNGQSTVNTNVLIYQSMSGDAADGQSTFTMKGGSMTAKTGVMFHVTNVTTTIDLEGVEFVNEGEGSAFLTATADSWGNAGSNGGQVTLNLKGQSVSGDILVDEVSSLTMNLTGNSAYAGAINPEGASGSLTVTLEEGSVWMLTADSYVDAFEGDLAGVDMNGYTLYVDGTAAK